MKSRTSISVFPQNFAITINECASALSCEKNQEFFEFLLNLKKYGNYISKFYYIKMKLVIHFFFVQIIYELCFWNKKKKTINLVIQLF